MQPVYKAKLERVVDGDTVDLIVDVGFYISVHQRFRLKGIAWVFGASKNSVQYKRGIAAKEYVVDLHRITTNVSLEVITLESMVDEWQISGLAWRWRKRIKDAKRKEALKISSVSRSTSLILSSQWTNNTKKNYHFLSCLIPTLFGLNAEANGTSLDVIGECTGISSIIVYCSIIFAYPPNTRNPIRVSEYVNFLRKNSSSNTVSVKAGNFDYVGIECDANFTLNEAIEITIEQFLQQSKAKFQIRIGLIWEVDFWFQLKQDLNRSFRGI